MLTRHGFVLLAIVVALAGSPSSGAATKGEVQQEIEALWDKVDSYTATVDTVSSLASGTVKMKTRGTGTIECKKDERTLLYRIDMTSSVDTGAAPVKQRILCVFDGTNLYNETELAGKPMIMKMKPNPSSGMVPIGGKGLFSRLADTFEITLLPDETIDGVDAYAFELRTKAGASGPKPDGVPEPPGVFKASFAKDTGLLVRMIVLDKTSTPLTTVTYKDFKVNPPLDAARFSYKPPEGSRVMSMESFAGAKPMSTPAPPKER